MRPQNALYIYLSAHGAQVLRARGAKWISGPFFPHSHSESATAAGSQPDIAAWLSAHHHTDCFVVLDVAEESFGDESIPVMSRRDTRLYMQRRLTQRFREAQFSHWMMLPRPRRGPGAPDIEARARIPLSVVNKNDVLTTWLGLIEHHELALHTVISPGLLALRWVQRHHKTAHALVVSWTSAGLRLTAIHNNLIIFSRLTPMNQPVSCETLRQECARTVSYLIMAKQIQHALCAAGSLPILIMQGGVADWEQLPTSLTLEAGLSLPLQRVPAASDDMPLMATLGAVPSWCRTLALRPVRGSPGCGYATRSMTQLGRLRRVERGLRWSGLISMVLAGCLLWGLMAWERIDPPESPELLAQKAAIVAEQQRLRAALARYPVHGAELEQMVKLSAQFRARHVPPEDIMRMVAHGLDAVAGIELTELRWLRLTAAQRGDWTTLELGSETSAGATVTSLSTPDGNNAGLNATPAPTSGPEPIVIELRGYLSDQTNLAAANQRVEALQKKIAQYCACTSHVTQLPYDPDTQTGFKREFIAPRLDDSAPAPSFAVRFLMGATPSSGF